MTVLVHDKQQWQLIWQRQGRNNAARWLQRVQQREPASDLIIREYDNLLRALEFVLQSPQDFDLAYDMIQLLFPDAFGFADWDRWLVYLEQARASSQQLNDLEAEAGLTMQIAEIHRNHGDLEKAKQNYRQAQTIYKQLKRPAKLAYVLSNMAIVYDVQEYRGLQLSQEALIAAQAAQDDEALAHVQMNISAICIQRRDWEAGLTVAESAYHLYQKLNKEALTVKAFFNMMICWESLGRWEEAKAATHQLMKILTKTQDVTTLAKLKNNLGIIALNQEKWDEAERHWQEALQLQSHLHSPTDHAFLLNNLGMLYTKSGELATAEEMLLQAIQIQKELGDIFHWANAVDNLVDVYLAMGKTAVAHNLLRHTIPPLKTVDAPHARKLLASMQAKLL